MSVKKIVPCLDFKDGKVVKGVNFVGLKEMGDPVEFAKKYEATGADELVFLDISKTQDGHQLLLDTIQAISSQISIPFIVGGGIATLDDIKEVLKAGASKVSIGSQALKNPEFITQASQAVGKEKIIVAIDMKRDSDTNQAFVYTRGGTQKTNKDALEWVKECQALGAGELMITSMDHDGVQTGFDIDFLKQASQAVDIPIIASGGAGSIQDFVDLFKKTSVVSGLAASIFHQDKVSIKELKETLVHEGIQVRK